MTYRNLTDEEQRTLGDNGCTAEDWKLVTVLDGFDAKRLIRVEFVGRNQIGSHVDTLVDNGIERPAGICDATLIDCSVGCNVRIHNVRVHLANYDIADNTCIEDVGRIATSPQATFGNGVEVEVLNEGGGREVVLFNELSAQFAYLMCLRRHQPKLIERLHKIATDYAAGQRSDRGTIGPDVVVCSVNEISNVNIGPSAEIRGAARLSDGTVLSAPEAPTLIGHGVDIEKFIVAEGAQVTGAAVLVKCYVGQACQIGRQFSAENSLFFANCEAFHGEAVAVFAGPYTVTHHKSTLLIAGLFSFYNAGSGTNQSNHMYKLGPVHEGKLERGCKCGSFSYMMWPCRVGAFSVVLGKHKRRFDLANFPFSLIEANAQGHCTMVPGLNLTTVGTLRDGAKWPTRDRRTCAWKRDRISFDVLSPYTVGRMMKGSDVLKKLQEETDKSVDSVNVHGALVKRVLLRTGQKLYRTGIEMYLLEHIVGRVESALTSGDVIADAMVAGSQTADEEDWTDIAGQLIPRWRLDALCTSIIDSTITNVTEFAAALTQIEKAYDEDEWCWVRQAYEQVFHRKIDELGADDLAELADSLAKLKGKYLRQILVDAKKEFGDTTGFGHGGTSDDVASDFDHVRGVYEQNSFVKQVQQQLVALDERIRAFKDALCSQSPTEKSLP